MPNRYKKLAGSRGRSMGQDTTSRAIVVDEPSPTPRPKRNVPMPKARPKRKPYNSITGMYTSD